ncbi:hypothetical protein ACFE04_020463 [Oxalis oulophora]
MVDRSRKLLPRQCKRLLPGQTSVDCVVPVVVVENYTRPLTHLAAKTVVAEEHFSNTTSCKKNKKKPRISNSQSSQLVVLSESNVNNKPTKRLTRHSYKNNNESKIQPIAQSLTQTENPNKATEYSNSEETLCSEAALPFAENKDDFATNQNFQEKDHICATKNDKKMQQESDTSSNRCTDVLEFGTQLEIPSEIDSEIPSDRAEVGTQASPGNALKLAICYEGRAIENVVNATKSNERSSTSKVIENSEKLHDRAEGGTQASAGNALKLAISYEGAVENATECNERRSTSKLVESGKSAENHDILKTEEPKTEGNESKEDMMESKTDLCSLGQEEEGPSRVSFSGSDGHVVSSPSREYLRDELNALNDAENEARNIDSLNASTSELVVNVYVDDNPTDMDSLFEEENKDHETSMIVI